MLRKAKKIQSRYLERGGGQWPVSLLGNVVLRKATRKKFLVFDVRKGYNAAQSAESQQMFRKNMSPSSSGSENKPSKIAA
jgi:hypothetical protein